MSLEKAMLFGLFVHQKTCTLVKYFVLPTFSDVVSISIIFMYKYIIIRYMCTHTHLHVLLQHFLAKSVSQPQTSESIHDAFHMPTFSVQQSTPPHGLRLLF